MSDRGEALADHVGLLVARVKELEAQLAAEKKAREEETARLEWLISCLNCMDMFAEFVNMWCDHRSTSQRRAESHEWRRAIDQSRDAARSLQGKNEPR